LTNMAPNRQGIGEEIIVAFRSAKERGFRGEPVKKSVRA
jgi:hypothetical protein